VSEATHIPQDELALYALRELSEAETTAVRAHLAVCASCRKDAAELAGDLALVGMSVEQHPLPEGARERLMEKIAADARDAGRVQIEKVVSIDEARSERRIYMSIPWAAVAAMLVFAFALMMKIGDLNRQVKEQTALLAQQAAVSSRAERVLDALTSRSAQRVLLTAANTKPAPSARAVYVASSGSLILQASHLDPLPAGKTYELWVIPADGKAPIPAGLFQPDAEGSASVILPALPSGVPAKAFGVTVERAEGATTPTAPIVLSGE
jgi:Anti-sigma-K factor rskA, C-terminal/Putative zinc-finger